MLGYVEFSAAPDVAESEGPSTGPTRIQQRGTNVARGTDHGTVPHVESVSIFSPTQRVLIARYFEAARGARTHEQKSVFSGQLHQRLKYEFSSIFGVLD